MGILELFFDIYQHQKVGHSPGFFSLLLFEVFNSVQKEMCCFLFFIWVGEPPSILCSYGHYCSVTAIWQAVRAAASAILQVIFRYNQDPTW